MNLDKELARQSIKATLIQTVISIVIVYVIMMLAQTSIDDRFSIFDVVVSSSISLILYMVVLLVINYLIAKYRGNHRGY